MADNVEQVAVVDVVAAALQRATRLNLAEIKREKSRAPQKSSKIEGRPLSSADRAQDS